MGISSGEIVLKSIRNPVFQVGLFPGQKSYMLPGQISLSGINGPEHNKVRIILKMRDFN